MPETLTRLLGPNALIHARRNGTDDTPACDLFAGDGPFVPTEIDHVNCYDCHCARFCEDCGEEIGEAVVNRNGGTCDECFDRHAAIEASEPFRQYP